MTALLAALCALAGLIVARPLDRAMETAAARVPQRSEPQSGTKSVLQVTNDSQHTSVPQSPVKFAIVLAMVEAAAALRLGITWALLPAVIVFAGLTALAFCDARHLLLPRRLQYPVIGATVGAELVASLASHDVHRLLTAVVSGAVAFSAFFVMNLISPRAMAFGDVRLAGAIGLFVGWYSPQRAVAAFVIGTVLAGLVSVVLLAARRASMRTALPYGVFLAAGAVVAVLM